ncbi:MAG: hypothetical protein C4547_11665 [Phycisphaerales bacterium]|nr:MAG: hypothetical protein C4547_11665 [Phycisphaerales bacterium]
MSECPTRDKLAAFENGELSEHDAEPLERHVAACPPCRRAVELMRAASLDASLLREAWQESVSGSAAAALPDAPADTAVSTDVFAVRPGLAADDEAPLGSADPGEAFWRVPDYERIQLCGEGAYGAVWAVRDRVGVFRALKILDVSRMRQANVGCRESTALETYCRKVGRHPYLIDIYHVGLVGNQLYYTMELADDAETKGPVSGETFPANYRPLTLYSVMRRRLIQPDTAIEIIRRLLRGLARLHRLDLVHRDIKPSNIVFVKHRPKLADIGMVAAGVDGAVVIGTPRYMPPDRVMDRTADTFAMGKVLHNMIAGQHPETFPALPAAFRKDTRKWDMAKINELIVRACAPAADDRYQSAVEMLDDLEACAVFPFGALFDEMDPSNTETVSVRRGAPSSRQIVLALIRAIPWVLAFIALLLVLNRLG